MSGGRKPTADGAVWSPPSPATELSLNGSALTLLSWSVPAEPGALTPLYDVLRSAKAEHFTATPCLDVDLTGNASSDAQVPLHIFHYLVRVKNPCGTTVGTGSQGAARDAELCP